MKPRISVVIPTRDRSGLLLHSLESLARQDLPSGEFEVVVVDDGSTDDTPEVCASFGRRLQLIHRRTAPSGIAAAKNLGVFLASAPIVLFFDDDDAAAHDLLRAHVAAHREQPADNVAVLGHTTWHREHLEVTPVMHYVTDVGHFLFSYSHLHDRQELDYTYFWGGRSSAKRLFLAQNGVFDQCFEFGSEDIELGYRLSPHGLRVVYRQDARSFMIRPVTYEEFCRRCERQGRSQWQFARLHDVPEIRRYCAIPGAPARWRRAQRTLEDRMERVRELESLSAEEREPFLSELHELYRSTFDDFKAKGIVEAADADAEASSRGRLAVKRRAQLAGREPALAGLVSRAANRARGRRILVMDHYLPIHDRASGSKRLFELLRLLAADGHAVTFVARDGQHGMRYVEELQQLGIETYAEWGLEEAKLRQPLAELVAERRFDLAFLSFFHVAEAYADTIRRLSPHTRVVVDSVDIHFLREERQAELEGDPRLRVRAAETKRRELAAYDEADAVVVVTDADREALLAELPGTTVYLLPNVHARAPQGRGFGEREGVLFVGNFGHLPNVDAVQWLCGEVLPLVRAELPDARVTIVGTSPPPEVEALAGDGVEVTGWVPEVEPYLLSHRVSVAPLRYGAGMKGKVGEALGHGLPVVTTSIGAEGMVDGGAGPLLVADDAGGFAAAVVRLYRDEELWSRLAVRGRDLVESRWSPEAVASQLRSFVETETAKAVDPELTSIVILAHDQLELTKACLASIEAHTAEPHELILVDNGSTDGTTDFLRAYAEEHEHVTLVLNSSNRGFAGGNNRGLALARGGTICLLNNDTLVTDGWLDRLRSALARDSRTGLVGPLSNHVSGPQRVEAGYADPAGLPRFAAALARRNAGQTQEVSRLVGFCLLVRRELVDRIGGFDERFGLGTLEDDDFTLRALGEGYRSRIARDAFVHHEGNQTFQALGLDYREAVVANWAIFKEKWEIPAETAVGEDYDVSAETLARAVRLCPLPCVGFEHERERRVWREVATGREVVAAAASAVRAGSADRLREAFGEAAAWTDPHRRYQMRCQLAEQALGSHSGDGSWLELFAVAAEWLLAALEEEPREPILLNHAGVLLYELLELGGAEALFRAAKRLEPSLPHVAANLAAVKRRKRGRARSLRGDLAVTVAGLGARARRVAATARPAQGLTVSLCMIVKDEEELLPGCLASVCEHVDELIVVDTGSSDRTVEIAESFGARVIRFPWTGSFAEARNVSLDAATGDWILYLDADEQLVPGDGCKLRALLGKTWREAFHLVETNYTGHDESGPAVAHLALRLFRNRPEYRFEGRIHEQKTQRMPTYLPERFETTTIRMVHYGYLKERIRSRGKSRRNLELLEHEAAESPTPFTAYNLGSEYSRLGELAAARAYLEEAKAALGDGWNHVGYGPILVTRLASVRRLTGDVSGARALLEEGLAVCADHTDLVLELALCAWDEGDLAEAERLARRCLEMGDAPATYIATVGSGTFLALGLLGELRRRSGDPAGAEEIYLRSLRQYPDYLGPVPTLVSLMLERGASVADVEAELPRGGRLLVSLLAGSAFLEAGHAEAAEHHFRSTLERQPGNGVARIGLVEALLSQSRFEDAAAEAAAEPPDSLLGAAAALSMLFARAALADAAGMAAALGAAEAAGVAEAELAFYRAWRSALADEPDDAAIPAECIPTAVTALEALLRVQEFEAFETGARVFERVELDARERRELLARVYLRRGFLESAADEWIAAACDEPDARALVGLAQVAYARGLREDAYRFATAALELEPEHGDAARMREALLARGGIAA